MRFYQLLFSLSFLLVSVSIKKLPWLSREHFTQFPDNSNNYYNQQKYSAAFHILNPILHVWKCQKLHCLLYLFIRFKNKSYVWLLNQSKFQPLNHPCNKYLERGPFSWQLHDSMPFLTAHMLQLNLVGSFSKHSTFHSIVHTHHPYCLSQFDKYDYLQDPTVDQ